VDDDNDGADDAEHDDDHDANADADADDDDDNDVVDDDDDDDDNDDADDDENDHDADDEEDEDNEYTDDGNVTRLTTCPSMISFRLFCACCALPFFSGLKRGACGHCKLSIFSGPRLSIFPFFFFFLFFAVLLSLQPLCSPGGALLFGCALSPGLLWCVSPLPVYIFRFERYHRLLIQPVVLPLLALLVFTGGVGPRQEKARCRLPASCAGELRSVSDDCMYHVRALNVRNIN
jgi:hypothetical protein